MLSTTQPSPRAPLRDSTNTSATPPNATSRARFLGLLTPTSQEKKRPLTGHKERVAKRAKPDAVPSANDEDDEDYDYDGPVKCTRQSYRAFANPALSLGIPGGFGRTWFSTRPILQSFVSHKTDIYTCPMVDLDGAFTLPYTCAYSDAAKKGGEPLLAVGTEQGIVHILNTTKRTEYEPERERTLLDSHRNAIFDVKWSPCSGMVATCSGDRNVRVACVNTQKTLHNLVGHGSTVKCVAWDPAHRDILSSGGRDGAILIWDLRVSNRQSGEDGDMCQPVITIPAGHCEGKKRERRSGAASPARSITSLLYPETGPNQLISSSALEGILRCWDTRFPTRKARSSKPKPPAALYTTLTDPTTLHGRRARGITSLTLGTGPTAGLIFALGADSRIHTYMLPTLEPLAGKVYTHPNMQISSFYVRLAASPCGRWLASGCGGTNGSLFLFDVSDAHRLGPLSPLDGRPVELRGQVGEIGGLDWAEGALASCADDGTVRVWRPDVEVYKNCLDNEEEAKYHWSWSRSGSGKKEA